MKNKNTPDCPKDFCFHFLPKGSFFAPGLYENLEKSFDEMKIVQQDSCGCPLPCQRITHVPSDKDHYEPHEPNLEAESLNHEHFVIKKDKS